MKVSVNGVTDDSEEEESRKNCERQADNTQQREARGMSRTCAVVVVAVVVVRLTDEDDGMDGRVSGCLLA